MNLPNAITVGRIAASPFVAWLPFLQSWPLRLLAFVLFVVVAVSDYYDGRLARSRNLITDLGKQLDPLADKLLLVATLVPMYVLMTRRPASLFVAFDRGSYFSLVAAIRERAFPFVTPWGVAMLPFWVIAIIVGREVVMTVFRQLAARRGVIIAAIGPAKWKTGFQLLWVGAAFFWFWIATAAAHYGWRGALWEGFAQFNGVVGVASMLGAVLLTLYSLGLYFWKYGGVLVSGREKA